MCERIVWDKPLYKKIPRFFKWCIASIITMFCWEFFRFESLGKIYEWLRMMIGMFPFERMMFSWEYYFTPRILFLMIVAILGATVFGAEQIQNHWKRITETKWGYAFQEAGLLMLFGISILCMVNSTYKPFIYFQY